MFDFSILSGGVAGDGTYGGGIAAILASVVARSILLVRRRRIEPRPS